MIWVPVVGVDERVGALVSEVVPLELIMVVGDVLLVPNELWDVGLWDAGLGDVGLGDVELAVLIVEIGVPVVISVTVIAVVGAGFWSKQTGKVVVVEAVIEQPVTTALLIVVQNSEADE